MILGCLAHATYPVRLRSSGGSSGPPTLNGGIYFFSHSLFFAPTISPFLVLHDQPFLALPLLHDGDAPGVGADQFGRLGQHLGKKRLEPFVSLLQKIGDLGKDLDFGVLAADLVITRSTISAWVCSSPISNSEKL